MNTDEQWMKQAITEAKKALAKNEVPIGGVVVCDGKVIGRGYNQKETKKSPLAHAEVIAIQKAAKKLGSWYLDKCTLYVTLEPCLMCTGLLWQCRISRVVYGLPDPKSGALGSLYQLNTDKRLNHRYEVVSGVLQDECHQLLKDFFRGRRAKSPCRK